MESLLSVIAWIFERGVAMLFGNAVDPDVMAIMIPITAIAGGIAITIVAIIMGARKKELDHKERLLAMEKGIEIPQSQEPEKRPAYRSNRTAGLIMTLLGTAIMVANWVTAGVKGGIWGLIPLAIGIGLLISASLEKREFERK